MTREWNWETDEHRSALRHAPDDPPSPEPSDVDEREDVWQQEQRLQRERGAA